MADSRFVRSWHGGCGDNKAGGYVDKQAKADRVMLYFEPSNFFSNTFQDFLLTSFKHKQKCEIATIDCWVKKTKISIECFHKTF